ncbi:MAG: asparagine synthase-related protein [Chlamydiales bacterium]
MGQISAIVYPSAFQVTELIDNMGFDSKGNYFRYKNLELGGWDVSAFNNERKTIWAFVEGQIYNASILREELKKLGFNFTQDTQSELITHAYEAWKENFLARLNGPFALAIFDEEQEILLMARDRIGQKSLYWTTHGEYWLVSTDIKSLLASGIVPQTPSTDALASYLYFGFIPQDLSSIQGINKILPGHYLKVGLKRQTLIGQYWSLSKQFELKKTFASEEIYHQFGELLEESIRVSLPKEELVGSFLLGDLGSSSLPWFLQREASSPNQVHAYASYLEREKTPELTQSQEIANNLSLPHQFAPIQIEEVFQKLPAMVWHLDEPIADLNLVRTWKLAELASKECGFVYTALGWDEMLAGSARYFKATEEKRPPFAHFLAHLPYPYLRHLVFPLLNLLRSEYKYRIIRNIDINREQVAYLAQTALFKGRNRKKVSPFLHRFFDPEAFTQRFHRLTALSGKINPSLYYDAKTYLPDSLLLQYERLLQPHGVKMVAPYLDANLVDFLATIPEEIKFEGEMAGSLLKHCMKRLFYISPPYLEGQPSFAEIWKDKLEFRPIFVELTRGRLVEEEFISKKWIRHKLSYPFLTTKTFEQLWAILVLEVWFRLYINRPMDITLSKLSLQELLES